MSSNPLWSPYLLVLIATLLYGCSKTEAVKESVSNDPAESIFLDYTEAGLDSAYNQVHWAPNLQLVVEQLTSLRDIAINAIGEPERIQYGETSFEELDLYQTDRENAPIHLFVHGGAWRGGNGTQRNAYLARKFVESGAIFIAPDYQLATDAEGSLYPMVEQLRTAVAWTYKNAKQYGGDPERIFVSGHSAGAHLAGVLITTDWSEYDVPEDVIKGAFLSSGMYDLYPVSLSSRNEYVSFTDQMIEDLSPINHIDRINMPVKILYGTQESPEFIRQSEKFAEELINVWKDVNLYVLPGYNHFEIIVALGNPFDLPGEVMLQQMGLD